MSVVKIFEKDNTIQFFATIHAYSNEIRDPDATPKITITDDGGATVVDSKDMLKYDTGRYKYFWQPTTAGKYIVKISANIAGKTIVIRKPFKVVETTIS